MSERICSTCKKPYTTSVRDRLLYTDSGLEHVYLRNVTVEECGCAAHPVIPAPKALHRYIALALVTKPALLTGQEIRFLRLTLQRKAKDFADEVSISAEQLSRVENGHEPVSEPLDKLTRRAAVWHLSREWNLDRYLDHEAYERVRSGRLERRPGATTIECEWSARTAEHPSTAPCRLEFTPTAPAA
jgi:DNA-binding transcriptional regulator YiaG